ncbi:SPOR domain-containing protein [Dechloromonas sp. ZY10]|uniref:SPOR domain-containing protein n=1 Tax=Dechloromonas aquae TaxID=2664436 RepID=UPI0035292683
MAKTPPSARKPVAPKPVAEQVEPEVQDELRGKLLKRLAVAGLLISLLLGTLAVFDHLAAPPQEEDDLPAFSKPIPVPPKKEVSQPVKQTTELPPPPEPAKAVEEPVAKDGTIGQRELPREGGKKIADELPPPRVEARPSLDGGKNPPVAASTVNVPLKPTAAPVEPVSPGSGAARAPAAGNPSPRPSRPSLAEGTAAPPLVPPSVPVESTVAKPSARVLETRSQTPAAAPVPGGQSAPRTPEPPRLFSGFALQAGVFSNPQLAEELHAKLTLSGVPSTLETRVQVGPFRTRQEAEAAQAKLRGLGIDTVLMAPRGGRR